MDGTEMTSAGALGACSRGLWLAFAFEIERHGGANKILQSRLVDVVVLMDVDGEPDFTLEARVEQA